MSEPSYLKEMSGQFRHHVWSHRLPPIRSTDAGPEVTLTLDDAELAKGNERWTTQLPDPFAAR